MVHVKLLKTQLHKLGLSRGFLGRILAPLLKSGLPLMKNVFKPLVKSVLITLALTAAASATDTATENAWIWSTLTKQTTLKISNEEMNDIKKIVKSLEESDLSIKGVSETIKIEAKKKKKDLSECY